MRSVLRSLSIAIGLAAIFTLAGRAHLLTPFEALAQTVQSEALARGARGRPVTVLQELLDDQGFTPGPIDGIFGPRTEGALRKAEDALGLTADGIADQKTVMALLEMSTPATNGAPLKPHTELVFHRAETADQTDSAPELAEMRSPTDAGHMFSLTFNGLPAREHIAPLLETLKQNGMKATFFVTGHDALREPDLLRLIVENGHEVGSMGEVEEDLTSKSPVVMRRQLIQASARIKAVTGAAPRHFRPPLGRFNDVLAAAAEGLQMRLVLWTNVGVRQEGGTTPNSLAQRLAGATYPGSVLMLRLDQAGAVETVEATLNLLQDRHLQSVTLETMLDH